MLCCARGMVRPVSQWCSTTIKNAQYNGSLVVDTPSDEMNVFYDTGSSNLWVSSSACCDGSQVTISTTWERSSTYVANGNTFSSGTARVQCQVLLQNAVNSGCTNHRLHFRRDAYVSRLEISFSLGRSNLTESAAWLMFHFHPIVWTEFILQWKVWWMLARSPPSPSTLKVKSMRSWPSVMSTARTTRETWRWLHNKSNSVSLTRWCSGEERKCRLLSAITRLISSDQVRPLGLCHDHNPPASIGYRGFVSAVGPDHNIGASRWLWSGRPLAVSSVKTSHYPTHGAVTPSIQEEGEEHIFRGQEF